MIKKSGIFAILLFTLLTTTSYSKDWADDTGSCFQKDDKFIAGGLSLFGDIVSYSGLGDFGPFVIFDMAFHKAIAGGIAIGYSYHSGTYWNYYSIPIIIRSSFHPFNLSVLSDKIDIRDKLDPYVGLTTGWKIRWETKKNGVITSASATDLNGFTLRELFGIRYYVKPNMFLSVEEGAGLGNINFSVGLKF